MVSPSYWWRRPFVAFDGRFNPILGDRFPFFLFFLAIALAAVYGGYGPALLDLALCRGHVLLNIFSSCLGAIPSLFGSKSQIAFAFIAVGLTITVLGGSWRDLATVRHRQQLRVASGVRRPAG